MYEFKVTGPVANINQGMLVLDDSQLRRRRGIVSVIDNHDLDLVDGTHLCQILAPVQFKHGESFFTDQAIDKLQAQSLSETGAAYEAPEPEKADEEPADDPDKDIDKDPEPNDQPQDYADWDTDMLDAELAEREISHHPNTGDPKKRGYLIDDDIAIAEAAASEFK